MKKKFLAILAIAIMIPLVLCACKKEKEEPVEPVTQEVVTEPATQAKPTESPEAAVKRLMDDVNALMYVDCVSLDCDESMIYYDESGYSYVQVTDKKYQSIGDIWEYLYDTFTTKGAEEMFPYLVNMGKEGSEPYSYIIVQDDPDVPDGLYELQAWNGFSTYENVSDIAISNQSDNGFTAVFTAEGFGQPCQVTIEVVAEDGANGAKIWKIDSLTENWEY